MQTSHFSKSLRSDKTLTVGHDYPVPVDKHDMFKILPHPLTPCGVNSQIFKVCNNSVICQYFY